MTNDLLNGGQDRYTDCLTTDRFDSFLEHEWRPQNMAIKESLHTIAQSTSDISSIMKWMGRWLMILLGGLIAANVTIALVHEVRASNTSFNGKIGDASIEVHPEQEKK